MDYNAMLRAADRDSGRATPERCAMFREILTALFAEFPPEGASSRGHLDICRESALRVLSKDLSPALAVLWARDTGVPNERIDAAYTLLFG